MLTTFSLGLALPYLWKKIYNQHAALCWFLLLFPGDWLGFGVPSATRDGLEGLQVQRSGRYAFEMNCGPLAIPGNFTSMLKYCSMCDYDYNPRKKVCLDIRVNDLYGYRLIFQISRFFSIHPEQQ
jgi:hypothetical protein